MKVLVTGATGRIGANVVKRLAERGDRVRCVVRPGSPRSAKLTPFAESNDVEIATVDLTDRDGLATAVEGVDAIVHYGARLGNTTHFEQLDINTAPTLTLLEAVRTRNPGLRRFVYGSSDTLFPHTGYMPGLITLDDIFRRPRSTYAVSKVAGGALVDCYHQMAGIPTVTLYIPYTFCGREFLGERVHAISPLIESHLEDLRQRPSSPDIVRTIAELRRAYDDGRRLVIPLCKEGPPHKHHLGDVRDVATATLLALEQESAVGNSFIVMSQPYHSDEAARHLAGISGLDVAEIAFPYSQFYEYDVTHAAEGLGFEPEYDGRQMLEDAWRHQQGEDIGVVAV